jgi:hypothetical protein
MRLWKSFRKAATLLAVSTIALLSGLACAASAPQAPATPQPPAAAPTASANAEPVPGALRMILPPQDVAVGDNRVFFAIIDTTVGPVVDAEVEIATFFVTDSGMEGPVERKEAVFRQWPVAGGVYTVEVNFDRVGQWAFGAVIRRPGYAPHTSSYMPLAVAQKSSTIAVGQAAPKSNSKTADLGEDLSGITSDPAPDADLYAMSIKQALKSGKPLMVAFSTPAFCQSATCGPQLAVVKQLKNKYRERMNFVHVEFYDNPDEIQGDLSNGRYSPLVEEWGLPSEPWTFVIDSEGIVVHKFEAFATTEELEEALLDVF